VWNIPTKQTMTQVLDQPYPKCVLWASACDLWTGQKDMLDCVCWWKHWYPCNKHLSMSTVHQWFQQWVLSILHVNNDDKRPRDLSEAIPEGWAATEMGAMQRQLAIFLLYYIILKAFICCYESAFSCPVSVGKLYGHRFPYSMAYFSQAILFKMMELMSANKPTQFSFPLCHSFLAMSSTSSHSY